MRPWIVPIMATASFRRPDSRILLGYSRISALEFGCGGGNGLLNAEMHIKEVTKLFSVDIDLYGFDAGSGLPAPTDYRDMPHYFRKVIRLLRQHPTEARLAPVSSQQPEAPLKIGSFAQSS